METIALEVQTRQEDENVKNLRKQSTIPCIVYGKVKNQLLKCKEQELQRVYTKAGESTVIELMVDGKNIPVLFHATNFDPISDRFEHVDFYAVDMTKEVSTHVPIRLEGESPAVKNLSGILLTVINEVSVKCLPKDLPHEFVISLEGLENFGDTVTVSDIKVADSVSIEHEPETVLVTVQEPRVEEEPEPVVAEGEEGEEGEEGKEGEAAAEGEEDKKKDDEKAEGDKGGGDKKKKE